MSVLNAALKKTTLSKIDEYNMRHDNCTSAHQTLLNGRENHLFHGVRQDAGNLLRGTRRADEGRRDIPRLDLNPEWTTSYNKSHYEFEISIYGTYVGRKRAKCLEGVESGKPVYFHESRPKESSLPQAAPSPEK